MGGLLKWPLSTSSRAVGGTSQPSWHLDTCPRPSLVAASPAAGEASGGEAPAARHPAARSGLAYVTYTSSHWPKQPVGGPEVRDTHRESTLSLCSALTLRGALLFSFLFLHLGEILRKQQKLRDATSLGVWRLLALSGTHF